MLWHCFWSGKLKKNIEFDAKSGIEKKETISVEAKGRKSKSREIKSVEIKSISIMKLVHRESTVELE